MLCLDGAAASSSRSQQRFLQFTMQQQAAGNSKKGNIIKHTCIHARLKNEETKTQARATYTHENNHCVSRQVARSRAETDEAQGLSKNTAQTKGQKYLPHNSFHYHSVDYSSLLV